MGVPDGAEQSRGPAASQAREVPASVLSVPTPRSVQRRRPGPVGGPVAAFGRCRMGAGRAASPIPPVAVRREMLTPTRSQRRRPRGVRLPPLTPWSGVVLGPLGVVVFALPAVAWARVASGAHTLPAGPGRRRRGRGVRAPVPGMKKSGVRLTKRRTKSSSPRLWPGCPGEPPDTP
jgi:hypothetical protein